MVKIKNVALVNKKLVTRYGTYTFDVKGIAEVPEDVAQKLSLSAGFIIVEKIVIPAADPTAKPANVEPTTKPAANADTSTKSAAKNK